MTRLAARAELRRVRVRPRPSCVELDPMTLRPFLVPPTRTPSPVPGVVAANVEKARRDLDRAKRRDLAGDLEPLERDVERMISAAELTLGPG